MKRVLSLINLERLYPYLLVLDYIIVNMLLYVLLD